MPPFPPGLRFDTPLIAVLSVLLPKKKLCDAPFNLPSSVACCYGNSGQWNGLSPEKKLRTPTPSLCSLPLARNPTLGSQRSFIHQKTVLAKGACRATLTELCCSLMRGSQCSAMPRLLVQLWTEHAFFLKTSYGDKQQTGLCSYCEIPPLPQSYPPVNLGGSSRVKNAWNLQTRDFGPQVV